MPKDANFDIAGHFALEHPNSQRVDYVSLDKEKFEFTKTRIIFSPSQKERFADNLNLDPFSYSCKLADNTHYKLSTTIENDKTIYQSEIECNNHVYILTLRLNSINLLKLKLVHDIFKVPKWLKWTIEKVIDNFLKAAIPLLMAYGGYRLGKYDEKTSTTNQPPLTNIKTDTTTQPKVAAHSPTSNGYNNTDTFHSVPYSNDTTKTK